MSGSSSFTVPPKQDPKAISLPRIDELLAAINEEVASNEGRLYVLVLGLTQKCIKAEQLIAKQTARLAMFENGMQAAIHEKLAKRDARIEKLEGMLASVRELVRQPTVSATLPQAGKTAK